MNINRSTIKLISLTLFLFFLSTKTSQSTIDTAEWLVIDLPNFILLICRHSTSLAAISLLCYFAANIFPQNNRLKFEIVATIFTLVLGYYHLRSFQVGSGDLLNIVAAIISVFLLLSFSLNRDVNIDIALRSLIYAFGGFIFVSIALYISGYGYPVSGSGRRFFGLTPHPNFQGTYSALAFALFISISSWNIFKANTTTLVALWSIALASAFLIVVSGSRTAIALAIITLLAAPRPRHRVLASIFIITAVFAIGSAILTIPDSNISLALTRAQDAPLDNRLEVWNALIGDFMDYPILGAGDRSGVSGSSFLTAFGGTGLLLGSIFTLCFGIIILKIVKLILRNRTRSQIDTKFIFSILLLQILAGCSFFEGYMFDKFGLIPTLTILMLVQIGARNYHSNIIGH